MLFLITIDLSLPVIKQLMLHETKIDRNASLFSVIFLRYLQTWGCDSTCRIPGSSAPESVEEKWEKRVVTGEMRSWWKHDEK